ncbi:MAG: FAD binding domain-containing protein [Pseudomonadota bacterium]
MLEVESFATLDEAARSMREGTRYLAGGTLVMRAANHAETGLERIVFARDPALRAIRREGAHVVIGAGVTMAGIMASAELSFLAPAARAVGGPAIRNMATVGGNLFAPAPYGDLATALLALDAVVRTTTGEEPIEAFLAGRERAQAQTRGLVSAIVVPVARGDAFRFLKVSRIKPKGVSVLAIAALLPRPVGRVEGARIAFGAMGPTPLRAKAAERALEGATLDDAGIRGAVAVATEGLAPVDDALASAWYRLEVAPVHLTRLLKGEGVRR